jgi:hypothetical protein
MTVRRLSGKGTLKRRKLNLFLIAGLSMIARAGSFSLKF